MLRVGRVTDRSGRYYLAEPADDLGPALPAARVGGWWTGAGAAGLGLSGRAAPDAVTTVLHGRHPGTGRQLVGRLGTVAAYDLTFAAPKSFSVLATLGGPDEAAAVVAAHHEAVEAAMGYVAAHAVAVRRGSGEDRRLLPVRGVVAAGFTHGVSRALDPHLHTHVVTANLALGADGRWSAVDGRGVYAHARAAGALYDAHLRSSLSERLGVRFERHHGETYEVAGVDRALLAALSMRRAEIAEDLARHPWRGPAGGPPGPAAHRTAWRLTRDPKPDGATRARPMWLRRAWAVGVDPEAAVGAAASHRPAPAFAGDRALDERQFAALLYRGPHAAVTRRDVVAAWAGASPGGASVSDAERCVDMLGDLGHGIGVGEAAHALGLVSAARHHLRALGPRPTSPDRLAWWRSAADELDRYRARWLQPEALFGARSEVAPPTLATMPARQLAEHLALERDVAEVRRRLGRGPARQQVVPERGLGR